MVYPIPTWSHYEDLEGMGGSRELGGYARERSLIMSTANHSPFSCASTVGLPSRSARFITSSTSRGRQAEKAQKYPLHLHQPTMSQQSTSCRIRRCNRRYIFLPQFTLVSRCRAQDEKFLSQTRSQAPSAIATNSVSSLPQQRLDPSRGGQMIAPKFSREKGQTRAELFPKEKGSQWMHSIPSRTERACFSPPRISRVCHLVSETLTRIGTPRKAFHNTHTSETRSPEDKKEDDVFHRRPFMLADAH